MSSFTHPIDRNRFCVSRGLLRTLLARYAGVDPKKIKFAAGPSGKPVLCNDPQLFFNSSRSQDRAIYAVSKLSEVGADLEKLRSNISFREVVGTYFSPRERIEFDALDPDQQKTAFFRVWTGKEAYLKALGYGLSVPLFDFTVSLDAPEHATLICEDHTRWQLHSFRPWADFVATVASEVADHQICHHTWPEPAAPCSTLGGQEHSTDRCSLCGHSPKLH
jgi:4'-phosphopantetheinyl transferase